jgi:cell division protein FtsW (lipid II flippase)
MRLAWRGTELRLLLPLLVLVPLGFALSHIVAFDTPDPGPLGLAAAYVGLVIAAHLALVLLGHRGDQLLLPLAATIGGVGLVMLNRLPQGLAGMNLLGLQLGMAETQLIWFGISLVAMVGIAVFFRDDGILRHYKYTWAMVGAALLAVTFLFGEEHNGARLWLAVGPVTFQPAEGIKIVLVVFVAGYLAEKRALLAGAYRLIGFVMIQQLP